MFRVLSLLLVVLLTGGCHRGSTAPPGAVDINDYVILIPDSRNDVVHRIAPNGDYLGDFLDGDRVETGAPPAPLWRSPRVVLYLDGNPGRVWLAAERALTEWSADGRYVKTLYADTVELEDPTGMVRVGDEVFVLSEDKSRIMVFDTKGELLRTFGYDMLDGAKDMKIGPDAKLYVAGQMFGGRPGLISIWDPSEAAAGSPPVGYHVPPDMTGDGTWWLSSLAFDGDRNLLVTEYSRGRLERWSTKTNERSEVLLDHETAGAYQKLVTGPDGMIYMAGAEGLFRFSPSAHAGDLTRLVPFFRADSLSPHYQQPFTPVSILFVRRSLLESGGERVAAR